MKDLATKDLDLVLDRQNFECPAVVKERLLRVDKEELSSDIWSTNDGYSWIVHRHELFVWKQDNKSNVIQFPLPTTGLPYSAKSIVVYKSGKTVGALAVSGEGCARHWPSLSSAEYFESTLDLSKEVVLSVQLLEHASRTSSTLLFVLATTSGTVLGLKTDPQTGSILAIKVGGREDKGIGRRLSSMIFGATKHSSESTRVIKALVYWSESDEVEENDEDSVFDPIAVTVSSVGLHAFDVKSKTSLWAFSNIALYDRVEETFKRIYHTDVVNTKVWILDIARFREGLLVLFAGTHDSASNITFFLGHISGDQSQKLGWSSHIPISASCEDHFDIMDESSFVGRIKLCVPQETADANSCSRTDGILIIYSSFVQSVYVPDDLKRVNELPLNKMLLCSTKMIGQAMDGRYCYTMMNNGGVFTLRLLPKGFEETGQHDISLGEVVPDIQPEDPNMDIFHAAFTHFAQKDIVKASTVMKPLLSLSSGDLASLVCQYLMQVIEQLDSNIVKENELRNKRRVCQGVILFLRHMDIYESIRTARLIHVYCGQNVTRSGANFLAQICERVAIAIAIREWQSFNEDNAEALSFISQNISKSQGYVGDTESIVLGKLMWMHLVPKTTIEVVNNALGRASKYQDRLVVLQIASDLFLTISNAISNCRRATTSVALVSNEEMWTGGDFAKAYDDMATLLLSELRNKEIARTEALRLRDYAVKLTIFNLGEQNDKIEGHPTLMTLYDIGEERIALDLAERFKDFKVLCRISLEYEKEARTERLEAYKKRFAHDDFDIYLCQYLKQKNLNEELLEQKGERVDGFLSSLDSMRWRRELQNSQYGKAAHSLLSLANREEKDLSKQKALYSFAKIAAICADEPDENTFLECNTKLTFIKRLENIPARIKQMVYPDNPNQPLNISEIIELYKIAVDEGDAEPEQVLDE